MYLNPTICVVVRMWAKAETVFLVFTHPHNYFIWYSFKGHLFLVLNADEPLIEYLCAFFLH